MSSPALVPWLSHPRWYNWMQRTPRWADALREGDAGALHAQLGMAFAFTLGVSLNNFTNRANYTGFSGVMTSEYFQQATSVANPRQVDFSLRFGF